MSSGVYCPAGARRAQRQLAWYALFDEFAAEADSTVAPTLAGPVSVFKFVCKYIPPTLQFDSPMEARCTLGREVLGVTRM